MTATFHDVHENLHCTLPEHRIPGATMDEVMYADDTICISTDTRSMNKLLERIKVIGEQYGLKLNKNRCEVMYTMEEANVQFKDGTKYLGKLK